MALQLSLLEQHVVVTVSGLPINGYLPCTQLEVQAYALLFSNETVFVKKKIHVKIAFSSYSTKSLTAHAAHP
jgi:hypothetical protein